MSKTGAILTLRQAQDEEAGLIPMSDKGRWNTTQESQSVTPKIRQ